MQNEHGPLLGRQTTECPIELVPSYEGHLGVRCRGPVYRKKLHLDEAATSVALGCAIAATNKEPMQPGIEAVGVAKSADIEPRAYEGVLDRILRPVLIPQDQPGGREETTDRSRREGRERVMIPRLRSHHKITLH